jgi:uncharacterized SAM-binding protein YcdF (DUF218 family)
MNDLFNSIAEFVFVENKISKSDIILIPGGSHVELANKAAELYHKGMAPLILTSGGINPKLTDFNNEAEFLNRKLIELNIPPEVILNETRATNTFENAKYSKDLLISRKIKADKIIIVCKSFHSRRVLLTYSAVLQCKNGIFIAPVIDSRDIRKDNWFYDKSKIIRVLSEVEKIGAYFEQWHTDI